MNQIEIAFWLNIFRISAIIFVIIKKLACIPKKTDYVGFLFPYSSMYLLRSWIQK